VKSNNQLPLVYLIKPPNPEQPELPRELPSTFNLTTAPTGGFQATKRGSFLFVKKKYSLLILV
jgi:hypothetical protein